RLVFGPITLLSFGPPQQDGSGISWPIEGGVLAAVPGGRWRLRWDSGELTALVDGYRPLLPRPLYELLQVPVHHLTTRLFLLGLRGRRPLPGRPAPSSRRAAAATI